MENWELRMENYIHTIRPQTVWSGVLSFIKLLLVSSGRLQTALPLKLAFPLTLNIQVLEGFDGDGVAASGKGVEGEL